MGFSDWLSGDRDDEEQAEAQSGDPSFVERDALDPELSKDLAKHWLKQIADESSSEKGHKDWREQAKKAEDHYNNEKGETDEDEGNYYPAFYNAVQIQHAVLYGGNPSPDVRRRFPDAFGNDPERQGDEQLALAVERAMSYHLDSGSSYADMSEAVEGFCVVSMGVTRVTKEKTDSGATKIAVERWPWSRYRWQPCSHWRDCNWIGFDSYLSADEIKEQFQIEPQGGGQGGSEGNPVFANKLEKDKTRVTEIFDRNARKVIVVAPGYETVLDYFVDPWKIEGFYTSAKPMMLGGPSDQMLPCPELLQVKHLVNQVNRLTRRLRRLERAAKDVTFYDAALGDIMPKLENASDGDYVPVESILEMLISAGGATLNLENIMARLPIADRVALFQALSAERDKNVQALNEAFGIADIMAGMSNPNEAADTQHLKSDWGSARMRKKRTIVNEHLRETLRIMADMVASTEPADLYQITGVELQPEQIEQLQSDSKRCYAIDIETDSTSVQDKTRDQRSKGEAMQAITTTIERLAPQVQQGVLPSQVLQELLLFGVRAFPAARSLEDSLGQLGQYMDHVQQLNGQMGEMDQQLQTTTQERDQLQHALGLAQAALDEFSEAQAAGDVAGAADKLASAKKKTAETAAIVQKLAIEGAQQVVPLGSGADELAEGAAQVQGWQGAIGH